jgi:hypothetical protein
LSMAIQVEPTLLDAVWHRLRQPVPHRVVQDERARVGRIVRDVWICRVDIEDLLEDWDSRVYRLDIFALANAADLPTRVVYRLHGNKLQRTFSGCDQIHRSDAAALMILFERLGFRVDPTEFVTAVLPNLKDIRHVTGGELAVLQFASSRHKTAALTLERVGSNEMWTQTEVIATPKGYKAKGYLDGHGNPLMIEVSSPRYRRRPEPVLTHCPECGMSYMRGDPEDGLTHRRAHHRYLSVADPKPHPKAAAAHANGWDGRVDATSPKWMHKEVYGRARLFKREFQYDFVQWHPDGERKPSVVGFLFSDPAGRGRLLGACCFRWRGHCDAPHRWTMDWIWLAPGARRTGLLTARWPSFLKEFGAFHVEHPLSDAMQAFLEKHGLPGTGRPGLT